MRADLSGKALRAAISGRRVGSSLCGVISALLALAAPAAAQSFTPPAGCEGVLTVQHRLCLVTHVWSCEADAPGEQWLALFTQAGLYNVRKVDEDFQWLETYYTNPPATERMLPDSPDPASLTTLFAEQTDTYDFTITNDRGTPDERVRGFDLLTGETVEIDGEPLLATEFGYEVTLPDGTVDYRGAGAQYVSERHRLFFLGTSWDAENPDEVTDMTPVDFVYPDEPGFFAESPIYDCGVLSKAVR